jgi:hypothetical protein
MIELYIFLKIRLKKDLTCEKKTINESDKNVIVFFSEKKNRIINFFLIYCYFDAVLLANILLNIK